MKKLRLLFFVMLILACNRGDGKRGFTDPSTDDINRIIQIIILTDSLPVLKRVDHSYPIEKELRKLIVASENPDKENIPPRILAPNQVAFPKFINSKFFSKKDSAYLFFQNTIPKSYNIDRNLYNRLRAITKQTVDSLHKLGKPVYFFYLTIPIFSADQNTAYVEETFKCYNDMCGYGWEVFLRKIKGKWVIVDQGRTWIS